jgi:hypothetical protein
LPVGAFTAATAATTAPAAPGTAETSSAAAAAAVRILRRGNVGKIHLLMQVALVSIGLRVGYEFLVICVPVVAAIRRPPVFVVIIASLVTRPDRCFSPRHPSHLSPRYSSQFACHDVASNTCEPLSPISLVMRLVTRFLG